LWQFATDMLGLMSVFTGREVQAPNAISAPPIISDWVIDLFNIIEALVVSRIALTRILLDG
jgi:hypothetical protein